MIYVWIKSDEEGAESRIIELENTIMDIKKMGVMRTKFGASLHISVSHWVDERDQVSFSDYWGVQYCRAGYALTVRRHQLTTGEEDPERKLLGYYTVAVFSAKEEAEAFDPSVLEWQLARSRPGFNWSKI